MFRFTFHRRLKNALMQPRQIMLLDNQSGKSARNLNIRPVSIIMTCLGMIAVGLLIGTQLQPTNSVKSIVPQHVQLQRQYDQLRDRIAESNALNELKDRQLESLKQESLTQQGHNTELSNRLRMLESILEARKANGVQLLNAEAQWVGKKALRYDLTLVKGGSYPRRISGSISLVVQSPKAETVLIKLGKQEPRLPFRIETHTFLRGLAEWEYDWHPDKILAILFDRKGKEISQTEILIDGVPK